MSKTFPALLAGLFGFALALPAFADSDGKGAIEKCSSSLGTLAVAEPQSEILTHLGHYKLGSPSTMLRMIAQESGCFTVVERGVAMQNLQQERALAAGGQFQEGSNVGGGQLQAADFVMTPAIQFSDDSGGVGGAVGGLLGRMPGMLGTLGGLAGGVKFKEAETTLLVADVRSGIQVASAEGKASKMNFSLGGWGWGGFGWASAGGYSKTPEGKLIAASLLDNYNKIVQDIRNKPQLIQVTSAASQRNAANSIKATTPGQGSVQRTSYAPTAPVRGGDEGSVIAGVYTAQFMGDDSGTVNVMVAPSGAVTGMGKSKKFNVAFQVSGTITPDGELAMSAQGSAGGSKFMGNVNPKTGAVMGVWQSMANGGMQGTFTGQRQQ